MKSYIYVLVGMFMFGMFGVSTPADAQFWKRNSSNNSAKVNVNLEKETVNFGVVRTNEMPGETLTFTNNSSVPVRIESFDRACGVTVPKYSSEVIQPGESGEITLMLNPRDVRGRFERDMSIVFVNANNTNEKFTHTINVRGSVIRGLDN